MNRGFDFDELVDRREVAALKYNAASMKRIFGEDDLFPSWVADMDFKAAPSVIAGLEVRAAHGVFGYLEENVALTRDYLSRHVPAVRVIEPDGTFLLWLDLCELDLDVEALQHLLVHEARLGLNMGHWFGREGAGFARLNIACPRASLEKALGQLATAIAALPGDAGR
jgi:bifunctional pyridoxal-dependent enzyme with beta-cystathionase and maltose regulon repressor activities